MSPESPEEIVDAIIEIVADEGRYNSMSHAARQHYEKNFRRDVHLRRLISAILGHEEYALSDLEL